MECKQKAPEVFCQCSAPESLLCMTCLGKHIVNNPRKGHENRPIDELLYYKIPGYFERLDTRREALPRVKEQALGSVGEVDRALGEYTAAVEEVIGTYTAHCERDVAEMELRIAQLKAQTKSTVRDLRAKSEEQIEKLKKLKRDLMAEVQTALEEVERTLVEDQPQLIGHYSSVLRQLTEASMPFQLFSYSIQTSAQPTITIKTHLRDSTAMELAQVTATYLRFFNCRTSAWSPQVLLRTHIHPDSSSVWVMLKDSGGLLCCGGNY